MTVFTVRFPTDEEEEGGRRFRVLNFYLANICEYLCDRFACDLDQVPWELLIEQRGLSGFQKIEKRSNLDEDLFRKYLFLSWASEIQMRLGQLNDPVMLQYSNCWAPVHAYYTIYMLSQAWFVSMGTLKPPDNHTGALRMIANQIKQRSIMPLPWSVWCEGCPQTRNVQYGGAPPNADTDRHIEVLAKPIAEEFWPRFGIMLRTTRERKLDRSFMEWKRQNNRKRMSRDQKENIAKNAGPTTIYDFFWRLRIRANYRDVSTFLMSSVDEAWHHDFFFHLLSVTVQTSTVLNNLIIRYCGANTYTQALKAFLSTDMVRMPEVFDPFEASKRLVIGQGIG